VSVLLSEVRVRNERDDSGSGANERAAIRLSEPRRKTLFTRRVREGDDTTLQSEKGSREERD